MSKRASVDIRDIGFLIAGLGVGLLVAPSSGKELRQDLGRNYRKTTKSMKRQAESLRDHADDVMEYAKHLQKRAQDLGERSFKLVRRKTA